MSMIKSKAIVLCVLPVFMIMCDIAASDEPAIPLSNFHAVNSHIWRSARPSYDGMAYLAHKGIKTIVDLENDATVVKQEAQWAANLGIQFISEPMDSFQPVDTARVNRILEILADPSEPSVLVHCMGGRDRTGLIVGLYRVLFEKWRPEDAHSEMVYFGFHTSYTYLEDYFRMRTGRQIPLIHSF